MEIIDVNVQWGFYPLSMIDSSPQRIASLLQEAGISKALALSFKSSFLSYREGNSETLHISQRIPALLPVLCVDPRDYPRCMEEIETAKGRGFLALRLFRKLCDRGLILKEILSLCSRLSLPVLMDFVPPLDSLDNLPNIVFLDIPLEELGEVYLLLQRDGVYLEFSPFLYATERLSDNLKDKLVFGSKLPFFPPSVRLRLIEEFFLSPGDRELVLGANAKKIFALP
ncbi:hypothetical protein H5T87_09715 [bacterium]|nr:hypothetical protein [bacterium]